MFRLITIIAVAIVLLQPLYGVEGEIRIVKSDEAGLTIEYIPSYQTPRTFTVGSDEYTRLHIEGVSLLPELQEGEPELYTYVLPVRFPGSQGNTVDLVQHEYEDVPNILLQPAPSFTSDEAGMTPVYQMNANAYSRNAFSPVALAEIRNIGETRGAILGNLFIAPIQYNPATRTMRKSSRIVVRVNYGSREQEESFTDPLIEGLAINDATYRSRRKTEQRSGSARLLINSVLASGSWFRFSINESGVYKITGASLLAAGIPQSTNPMNLKLYNNGGVELPATVTAPYADDLLEVAIYTVDASSNNVLDADDYIIFYGKGVRGWNYTSSSKTFTHYINHFTETNVYWLTIGANSSKQMQTLQFLPSAPAFEPRTVRGKLFREDDKINVLGSGLEWLGQQFNAGESFTYVHPLPGLDITAPIVYKFTVGAQAKATSVFRMYEHSNLLFTSPGISGTDIANYGLYFVATNPKVGTASVLPNFDDGQSQLRFAFSSNDVYGYGFLDSYELFYQQFPGAQNNVFTFHAHDTTAVTTYRIPGFSTNQVFVFDVTKFDSVLMNSQPELSVDTCSFTLQLQSGTAREIYAVGKNNFLTVGALTPAANQNLHGDTTEADEIIITNSTLMPAAVRLKNHRERAGDEYVRTLIVDIEKIYNEFGGGLPSPRAVRNYLKYLYTNGSVPPKYLLLFGDGDYDYRGITSQSGGKIPVWETGTEFHPIYSYATDDDFVIFNTSLRVALGVGRIPAKTLAEAHTAVDKIIEYELGSTNDLWKLNVTLVADDGWAGGQNVEGYSHADDVELLSRYIPELFQTRKLFLHEYATVFNANGRRKPAANEAIRNQINSGATVLNFAGHGNPRLWTHEQVFVRETDFPLLSNKGRYFFLVAATCNYSAMDMLTEQSSGEILMMLPNAGAIASYSATRPVYAFRNSSLNIALYQKLFARNSAGQVSPARLGDVVFQTRQNFSDVNDRKYVLLGDPAVRIAFPKMLTVVDSINDAPSTQTAQLKALSVSSLTASVRDTSLNLVPGISGTAQVAVHDAIKRVIISDPEDGDFSYKLTGDVIFRGEARIENGTIRTQFIVPKDISYTNDFGKVTVYFATATTDGAGFTTNVRVGGTDTTAGSDDEGPAVRLYLDRRTFRSGDLVNANPLLIADLEDEHGINTSGAGIGHRIEAWLDNSAQSMDLTPYYKSKLDTYKEGVVEYPLGTLTPGTHTIKMRAWDTYNNSSQSETGFDVMQSMGLQLTSVFNFPNPFSSSTVFSIEHNQYVDVDAEVKIYTVAGRLIQSLDARNVNTRIINIPWDGRDHDGDEIANGIYLYKAIVKTTDRRFTGEAYGKLSVVK